MATIPAVRTKAHAAVRLPRAQRRDQIVRDAAAVFLAGGYEKTSMEDIARAAGVTRLIVYRIFESKEALYLAVLSAVLDDIAASFDFGVAPDEFEAHPLVRRESVVEILLGIARRHPDGFRLLWRHTSNQAEFSELFSLFKSAAADYAVALLATAIPDPTINRWAAETLVSHLYESICLWLDRGDPGRDGEFLRMLTDGVRAMVTVWVADVSRGERRDRRPSSRNRR